jgi:hypothetical protein
MTVWKSYKKKKKVKFVKNNGIFLQKSTFSCDQSNIGSGAVRSKPIIKENEETYMSFGRRRRSCNGSW